MKYSKQEMSLNERDTLKEVLFSEREQLFRLHGALLAAESHDLRRELLELFSGALGTLAFARELARDILKPPEGEKEALSAAKKAGKELAGLSEK